MAEYNKVDESQPLNEESFVILDTDQENDQEEGFENTPASPTLRVLQELKILDKDYQRQQKDHAVQNTNIVQCHSNETFDMDDSFVLINEKSCNESVRSKISIHVNEDCTVFSESQRIFDNDGNRPESEQLSKRFDVQKPLYLKGTNKALLEHMNDEDPEIQGFDEGNEYDANSNSHNGNSATLQLTENDSVYDYKGGQEIATRSSKEDIRSQSIDKPLRQNTMENVEKHYPTDSDRDKPNSLQTVVTSVNVPPQGTVQQIGTSHNKEKISHDGVNATTNSKSNQSTLISPEDFKEDPLPPRTELFEEKGSISTALPYQDALTKNGVLEDSPLSSNSESFCVINKNSIQLEDLSSSTREASNVDIKYDTIEMERNCVKLQNEIFQPSDFNHANVENNVRESVAERQITGTRIVTVKQGNGSSVKEETKEARKQAEASRDDGETFKNENSKKKQNLDMMHCDHRNIHESKEKMENENQPSKEIYSPSLNEERDRITLGNESKSVLGKFGEIQLIKVGKFWLISLNGSKSKLPATINTDLTLRFEIVKNMPMLVTDSLCYNISILENTLSLEENNYHLKQRTLLRKEDFQGFQMAESSTDGDHEEQQQINRSSSPFVKVPDTSSKGAEDSRTRADDGVQANGSRSFEVFYRDRSLNGEATTDSNPSNEKSFELKDSLLKKEGIDCIENSEKTPKIKGQYFASENTDDSISEVKTFDKVIMEVKLQRVDGIICLSIDGKILEIPDNIKHDEILNIENKGEQVFLISNSIKYELKSMNGNVIIVDERSNHELMLLEMKSSHKGETKSLRQPGLIAEGDEDEEKSVVNKVEDSKNLTENQNESQKKVSDSLCFQNDSETVTLDATALSVCGSFGQIKLIKVGKFWLIAINGLKSKLPISVNTDPTLKFEIENKEVLLLSDTVCYKVNLHDNNLSLEEVNYYLQTNKVKSEDMQEDAVRTDSFEKLCQETKQQEPENLDKFDGKEEVKDPKMDELNKLMMQLSVEDTKLYNNSADRSKKFGSKNAEEGSCSGTEYDLDVKDSSAEISPKDERKTLTSRPPNPSIVTRRVALPNHLPWKRLLKEFQIEAKIKRNFNLDESIYLSFGSESCLQITGTIENVRAAENYLEKDVIEKIIKREIHLRFQVMDTFQKTSICRILEGNFSEGLFLHFENYKLFVVCFGKYDCDKVVNTICNSVTEKTIALAGGWRKEDRIKTVVAQLQRIEKGVYISTGENRSSLVVTGLKSEVNDLARQIEKLTTTGNSTMLQRDLSFTPKMKIHALTPCDTWLQLAKRFEISKVLSYQDKSVAVEFEKTQENSKTVCKCTIKGDNENVIEAVHKRFLDNYVNKLRTTTIQLRIKRLHVPLQTELCTLMNDMYLDLLILPDKDDFVLLTFDENLDLLSASRSIRRDFTENKIQLQGSWKQPEPAQKMIEEIRRTYDKINIDIDETDLSLYIVGTKEHVNAATNEIVEKMTYENRVTKSMNLEDGPSLDILVEDRSFLKALERKYVIDIQLSLQEKCLKVHGENFSVLCCETDIKEYCSNVITDKILVNKSQMDKIKTIFARDESNVKIESRLHSAGVEQSYVGFKDDSKERKSYTFPNGQKLIILDKIYENGDSGSNVIVNMREESIGPEGLTRHNDHGLIRIQLNIPVWSDDAVLRTKRFITKILNEVGKDNESVIDFKIPSLTSWSTDDVLSCFLGAIYKHCMGMEKGTNPQFIILSPLETEYEYFVGSCKIQFNELLKVLDGEYCHAQNNLQISLVEGKLNEFKADVLVNTAAANLDLRQGAVSSALLTTAGHQMQDEVKKNCKHLLKPCEIVTSKGYKLQCHHVFHGTLSLFDERRQDILREQYRSFLRKCLSKATEFKAKSIAFPAIGIGNLRYPVAFVATEMFATVKEFKQPTTLQHVYFVVFPGDRTAVQAFRMQEQEERRFTEKSATDAPNMTNQSRIVEIKVTGHKDNVRRALETIQSIQNERNSNDENNMKPMSYADAIKLPPSVPVTESLPSTIRQAFACETTEGLCVRVYASDMLHLPVDCIVNLAEPNLDHSNGLASLIADSAGDDLKRACRDYIRDNRHMHVGQVMKSSAGNLKYRCIIHAVWPQWVDYTPYAEEKVLAYQNDLKKTIIASLNLAEREALSSVAIPAISFGNQNAPCELSVMQFVIAITEFSGSKLKQTRRLKEVHIVDVEGKNAALFKQGFAEMLINNRPCPWNWRVYVKQNGSRVESQKSEQSSGKDAFNTLPYFMETGEGISCKITQLRIVNISHGDLLNFKRSDAVVCSEDTSGSAVGGVAKLLLQHGGWTYEHEKRHQYQTNRFKTGEIFITSGGDSGFREIIHAIMPHRMHFPKQGEKQWENALSDTINKIFETVEQKKYNSVVMSLLGTGAGSSDPKQCAKILLDSFMYSCSKYPDTALFLDVVNYDKNRHKAVVSVFKDGVNQSRAYTSQNMWISEPKDDRDLHSKVKAVCPRNDTVFGSMVGDQPDGTMTIDLIGLQLPGYSCRTIKITYKFNGGKQRVGRKSVVNDRALTPPTDSAGHAH